MTIELALGGGQFQISNLAMASEAKSVPCLD
jgi:hypothetical protein